MPIIVPVFRVLKACQGERNAGPLVLRPLAGERVDRCDVYRLVLRITGAAAIPRHISPHSLRDAAIINALNARVLAARGPDPCPAR